MQWTYLNVSSKMCGKDDGRIQNLGVNKLTFTVGKKMVGA